MAVAQQTGIGQVQHRRVAPSGIDLFDVLLAPLEKSKPEARDARDISKMVTIDYEGWNLCERCDLFCAQVRGTDAFD